jgi:Nitrile hydratase, alpha chain
MQMSRGEMQDVLSKFSVENPTYRAALLRNPGKVVTEQFRMEVPAGVTVKAIEENANTVYVVVPHVPGRGAELADEDLEKVAGGAMVKEASCDEAILGTVVEINASLF